MSNTDQDAARNERLNAIERRADDHHRHRVDVVEASFENEARVMLSNILYELYPDNVSDILPHTNPAHYAGGDFLPPRLGTVINDVASYGVSPLQMQVSGTDVYLFRKYIEASQYAILAFSKKHVFTNAKSGVQLLNKVMDAIRLMNHVQLLAPDVSVSELLDTGRVSVSNVVENFENEDDSDEMPALVSDDAANKVEKVEQVEKAEKTAEVKKSTKIVKVDDNEEENEEENEEDKSSSLDLSNSSESNNSDDDSDSSTELADDDSNSEESSKEVVVVPIRKNAKKDKKGKGDKKDKKDKKNKKNKK